MKKVLLLMMVFLPLALFSQESKGHKVFCELLGTAKFMSAKINVQVDFGQNPYKDSRIVDENGKTKTFNSMVDAMNFMGSLGWEFEQAYVVTVGSQNVYHWLLSKTITDEEAINAGFKTKDDMKNNAK